MKHIEIRIRGRIDIDWSDWFAGLEITYLNGNTMIQGVMADVSAIYGLIEKIKNLGVELILVDITDVGEHDARDEEDEE